MRNFTVDYKQGKSINWTMTLEISTSYGSQRVEITCNPIQRRADIKAKRYFLLKNTFTQNQQKTNHFMLSVSKKKKD